MGGVISESANSDNKSADDGSTDGENTPATTPALELHTSDALVVRGVARLASEQGIRLVNAQECVAEELEPIVIIVDLDAPGALEVVASRRAQYSRALIVGHLGRPDRQLWESAEHSGCDLVGNRGAIAKQLRERLSRPGALRGRQRIFLCDAADVAGRLGVVRRLEESTVGPIALWNNAGKLSCLADVCPHAGAILSEGEVEGTYITCPRHGSQFDLQTGERVRGPSDLGVFSFDVVEEEGRIWAMWA